MPEFSRTLADRMVRGYCCCCCCGGAAAAAAAVAAASAAAPPLLRASCRVASRRSAARRAPLSSLASSHPLTLHPLHRPARQTFFNDNPAADAFGKVKDQLAEVKDVMVENIERVLARGEKIELLVDKSDQLNQSARKFQKSSKNLKNVMWFKNVKMWALIALIVAVLIWLISSFICGFNYSAFTLTVAPTYASAQFDPACQRVASLFFGSHRSRRQVQRLARSF